MRLPTQTAKFRSNKRKYVSSAIKQKSIIQKLTRKNVIYNEVKLKLQELCDIPIVWKETVGLILIVRMKNKIFPKAFFPGKKTKMMRFDDLFMKIDDLHPSDFSERGLWHCILCSNRHWPRCLSQEISSFSARGLAVPILWQTNHTSVALILEAQTLPRNMTIFHLITLHILFQWNLDKTFKNFIDNFTVANIDASCI